MSHNLWYASEDIFIEDLHDSITESLNFDINRKTMSAMSFPSWTPYKYLRIGVTAFKA